MFWNFGHWPYHGAYAHPLSPVLEVLNKHQQVAPRGRPERPLLNGIVSTKLLLQFPSAVSVSSMLPHCSLGSDVVNVALYGR